MKRNFLKIHCVNMRTIILHFTIKSPFVIVSKIIVTTNSCTVQLYLRSVAAALVAILGWQFSLLPELSSATLHLLRRLTQVFVEEKLRLFVFFPSLFYLSYDFRCIIYFGRIS